MSSIQCNCVRGCSMESRRVTVQKEHQIEMLVAAKDNLEEMVINLQKEMLQNQDNMMDKIILKAAMDFDDKNYPPKK